MADRALGADERPTDTAARIAAPDAVVLETKLTPPPARSEHVERRDLVAALEAGSARKLTLVAAPPGFGKSTLLAAWSATHAASTVAWLSLDDTDNDPARFLP